VDRPARILISDDSHIWQGIFAGLLTTAQYEIVSATNLQETLRQLSRCTFELVVVDICLDDKNERNTDGVETIRAISKLAEGTQAIVLTGYGTVELAVSAIREFDVFHFLQKEKFEKVIFLNLVAQAVRKAQVTFTQLNLGKDLLSFFQSVDLNAASSMFGIRLERLQFILKNLILRTSPIVSPKTNAQLIGTGIESKIILDYWSKAFACGMHLSVGDKHIIESSDSREVAASLEEGGIIGMVGMMRGSEFEEFALQQS
jgi:ActR/RegA family two-component response regulator